jgi:Cu(I)/Ag(I) efflux system membrane fusion protein
MLKKIGIYCVILLSGILLGYIFFVPDNNALPGPSSESLENVGKWTCSMHPEIDGKENGTCPLCNMDLVYMDTQSSNELSVSQFKMTKEAIALANIETLKVANNASTRMSIFLSGKITTNKETDAVQTTLYDGRLDKLYSNSIGKRIRAGQEFGLIYSPELYLAQDKLLSAVSYKKKHEKLYESARNTYGLWKLSDEQIDKLIRDGKPLVNFPLVSDVRGTITEVIASEGNFYKQGDILFKTSDLRTVWGVFDAYESQLKMLKLGQEITLKLIGLPNENITGKISFIEPILNEQKRTATIRVVLSNKQNLLKPGMVVEGEVAGFSMSNDMVSIPKSAILWTGKRSIVYKKIFNKNQSIFEMTEVILGQRYGYVYEVLDGVNIDDVIVTNGLFTIDAAAQLSGKKSMMSKRGKFLNEKQYDFQTDSKKLHSEIDINLKFDTVLDNVLNDYMLIKDDLVKSDLAKVNLHAKDLLKTLSKINVQLYFDENSDKLKGVKEGLNMMLKTENIEKKRIAFKNLSSNMIALLSFTNGLNKKVYVQHCDCVDDFSGGDWLTYREIIENPYFDDTMLTCGRIDKIFEKVTD